MDQPSYILPRSTNAPADKLCKHTGCLTAHSRWMLPTRYRFQFFANNMLLRSSRLILVLLSICSYSF